MNVNGVHHAFSYYQLRARRKRVAGVSDNLKGVQRRTI